MAKKCTRKKRPQPTPRARQVLTLVVNAVALGRHDDDAEIEAIAKTIGTPPARLRRAG